MKLFSRNKKRATARAAFHYQGHRLSIPLRPDAAEALEAWLTEHSDEIQRVLAQYGVHPYDVCVPEWRQIVPAEDVIPRGQG